jgi:hypothetical protein
MPMKSPSDPAFIRLDKPDAVLAEMIDALSFANTAMYLVFSAKDLMDPYVAIPEALTDQLAEALEDLIGRIEGAMDRHSAHLLAERAHGR